ncbi:extracellular solute-binding protein family 1 [Ruminiclostridium papyrosolvens DSM 2782]|uniref:Extracellular solute-binding protein family 1 n=1 Tax=Ruminiclostridium papyrosolvens DSM 2782 TaxID=588581 RepID=F1TB52_9FIRM|nr:extracellular solute-binding protein [Ruminiclostridium papyrosolvens]EGD48256.1 extracellular solute-binding protein family 1 [Ruminiclostridium papyrosolvens DSM 2782]WES34237.1 extracellular solute-binding protein [Ruminiclostridium papyrosolvens DSM 2782]
MNKRLLPLILAFVLIIVGVAGCKKKELSPKIPSQGTASKTSKSSLAKSTAINIFVNNPEYVDAINEYLKEYKKNKPNLKVNLKTVQSDYSQMLKTKIKSGEMPDVFTTAAGSEIKEYAKYSYDLTGQPLAKAMTDEARMNMSYKGKVYGFPVKENVYGLVYNKDLFDKNKIPVPKTLVELEAAAQKLKSVGIQPFSTGYKEVWVFRHVFMHFMDASMPDDVEGLAKNLTSGKDKFETYPLINDNFFRFIDLTVKYGDIKPLETDLSAELTDFAMGKAAMIIGQGSWAEADILKINPKMKLGITGYPVDDKTSNAFIVAGTEQATRIYKDSPVLSEVLDLYNWLFTSDYGKKWFSKIAKVMPPINGADVTKIQIAKEFETYKKDNKVGDMYINYVKDDFHQKFGEIIQGYIAKTYTKEQAVKEIEGTFKKTGKEK